MEKADTRLHIVKKVEIDHDSLIGSVEDFKIQSNERLQNSFEKLHSADILYSTSKRNNSTVFTPNSSGFQTDDNQIVTVLKPVKMIDLNSNEDKKNCEEDANHTLIR